MRLKHTAPCSRVPTAVPGRGSEQVVPAPSPAPPPQDTVGDTYIRSINDLSLQLKNQDPEEVKTICQRRSQLNNRPVPDWAGQGGQERGGQPPQAQLFTTTPWPGGRVSKATCSSISNSLKGPWRYTRCAENWMTSLNGLGRR